jgi:hypothetical protein
VQRIEQLAVAGGISRVESTRRRWSSGSSAEEISPISKTGRNSSQVASVLTAQNCTGAFTVPISTQSTSRLDDNELTACCQSWLPQGNFLRRENSKSPPGRGGGRYRHRSAEFWFHATCNSNFPSQLGAPGVRDIIPTEWCVRTSEIENSH